MFTQEPMQILRARGGKKFGGFYVDIKFDPNLMPLPSARSLLIARARVEQSRLDTLAIKTQDQYAIFLREPTREETRKILSRPE